MDKLSRATVYRLKKKIKYTQYTSYYYWSDHPCQEQKMKKKKKKSSRGNYTEQSFACITQQKTKGRLSKARCVSLQGKKHAVR